MGTKDILYGFYKLTGVIGLRGRYRKHWIVERKFGISGLQYKEGPKTGTIFIEYLNDMTDANLHQKT